MYITHEYVDCVGKDVQFLNISTHNVASCSITTTHKIIHFTPTDYATYTLTTIHNHQPIHLSKHPHPQT